MQRYGLNQYGTVIDDEGFLVMYDDVDDLEARIKSRDAELAAVRKWLVEHAYEPGVKEHAAELSDAMAAARSDPSPGELNLLRTCPDCACEWTTGEARTPSPAMDRLLERVANLEDQAERVDRYLGHLPGLTGVCVRGMASDVKELQKRARANAGCFVDRLYELDKRLDDLNGWQEGILGRLAALESKP
jgi:hypothetical protein